jgi:5-(carboxyamino)imidazole ribonucleotide synthase
MGGGQLGRMFAHAAQSMGFKVAVLEADADCPAGQVADRLINAAYDDGAALAELGALCAAVTTEFENVSAKSLATLAAQTFVAPAFRRVDCAGPHCRRPSSPNADRSPACCRHRTW